MWNWNSKRLTVKILSIPKIAGGRVVVVVAFLFRFSTNSSEGGGCGLCKQTVLVSHHVYHFYDPIRRERAIHTFYILVVARANPVIRRRSMTSTTGVILQNSPSLAEGQVLIFRWITPFPLLPAFLGLNANLIFTCVPVIINMKSSFILQLHFIANRTAPTTEYTIFAAKFLWSARCVNTHTHTHSLPCLPKRA